MARIGNSVYSDICPGDPTCSKFGFDRNRKPTPMMAASLLYKLHHGSADRNLFEHVFDSKYGKVKIYRVKRVSRKSKKWIAASENKICDAPGSWYCVGQYPPALDKLMAKKEAFTQLEDFNAKKGKNHEKYQQEYMARMSGGGKQSGAGKDDDQKKIKTPAQQEKVAREQLRAMKKSTWIVD